MKMLLVKPSTEILAMSLHPLQLIEVAGRICYKSEDKITQDSAPKFAEMILKRGHESVIEHAVATARFICDRGVTHEIVRHRLASYSQESTRYCDYIGGQVSFVIPPWVNIQPGQYLYGDTMLLGNIPDAEKYWFTSMGIAEKQYRSLRELGWRPEQARSVLPNSLKTEIVMTANFREWRHFFELRTSSAAHPQMREVAIPLLEQFRAVVPVLFDDI
jgi:thymidylate synthase (FAD)